MIKIRFAVCSIMFLVWLSQSASVFAERQDELFAELLNQMELARESEEVSYESAYKYYLKAMEIANEILSEFGDSEIAQKLAKEEFKIDNHGLKEFREKFLPKIKQKSEAESNLVDCAGFLYGFCENSFVKFKLLNLIAAKYAANNQKTKAFLLLEQAVNLNYEDEPTKHIVNLTIIEGFAKIGEYEKAISLVKKLEPENIKRQDEVFVAIASCYIKEKRFDDALNLLDNIQSSKNTGLLLAEIGIGYALNKEKIKAIEFLAKSKDIASKNNDIVLIKLVQGFTLIGDFTEAMALSRNITDEYFKYYAWGEVSMGYLNAMQEEKCIKLFEKISNLSVKDYFAMLIVEYYAKEAQFEKAENILNGIDGKNEKNGAFMVLGGEYAKKSNYVEANIKLSQITDASAKVLLLSIIGYSYAKEGKKEEASDAVCKALYQVQEIESNADKVKALLNIVDKYSESDKNLDMKSKQILHEIIRKTGK